jgi:hypothetical protein
MHTAAEMPLAGSAATGPNFHIKHKRATVQRGIGRKPATVQHAAQSLVGNAKAFRRRCHRKHRRFRADHRSVGGVTPALGLLAIRNATQAPWRSRGDKTRVRFVSRPRRTGANREELAQGNRFQVAPEAEKKRRILPYILKLLTHAGNSPPMGPHAPIRTGE